MSRQINYSQAINEALSIALEKDSSVICYGLGTDDPKGIFGTTLGLQEKFGSERVFDMPTSENAMTGVAIGASLNGIRPIMTHQRLDFFLLAMDQLVNNAAKWRYMFGDQASVPITIRLIIGRGWGQGPTHSQNLQAWFSHIPGLKVVMPTSAYDAKGLLLSSIFDNDPVIFLEHRWLHNNICNVPKEEYLIPIGSADLIKEGKDCTIVSMSYMTIEARYALDNLKEQGITCDLIDLRSIKPIDWNTIFTSVQKTGRLLVLDTGSETGSISGEIITKVAIECYNDLKTAPQRITLPDIPTPTSPELTKHFYNNSNTVISKICNMLEVEVSNYETNKILDIPGEWFKGPF